VRSDMLLAAKRPLCKAAFSAQNVGNALYGLQGMSSEHSEVRDMLSSLVRPGNLAGEALERWEWATRSTGCKA
jgi:hypothetical protein